MTIVGVLATIVVLAVILAVIGAAGWIGVQVIFRGWNISRGNVPPPTPEPPPTITKATLPSVTGPKPPGSKPRRPSRRR